MLTIAILILVLYVILSVIKPGIALITSPVVCSLLAYAGVLTGISEAVLTAPVIFLVTLAIISVKSGEPDAEQWPQIWAKWILIIIAFLLLLATAIVVFSSVGDAGFIPFTLFFIATLIFIGAIISYALTSRHATAAYVISTIGSSMRQNLPLPMALESAAGGRDDSRSKILQRIQKWLVQGCSLSESINRGYPKCPAYAAAMIAAAERIDQLPLAMEAIEADMAAKADERRKIRPVHPLYPVILIVFTFLILWGVMTFVIPPFESALTEMVGGEVDLPAPTRLLIGIANLMENEYGWLIVSAFALIVLVVVRSSTQIGSRPRRPQEQYLLSRIGDFIKWHLPVLHWFEKNYSMVQTVELLRLSLNAGSTVNDAIANTIDLNVNDCFRKRLKRWLQKVECGDNIAAAARKERLGSPLAWAFDGQVNQDNTLAILETLESFYRSNYSYRANIVRFIMWPCITLVLGTAVGFVLYSVLSPMIMILNTMANAVTP